MGRKRSKKATFGPDDYNQPTEPMERLVLPPPANSTYRTNGSSGDAWVAPASQLETSFWPQSPSALSPYQNQGQVYPILPPARRSARAGKRRRSALPGLVGWLSALVLLVL